MKAPIKRAPKFLLSSEIEEREKERLKFEPPGEWHRAGGGCICQACGKEYYDHPRHDPFLELTVLCDDTLVKL